MKNINLDFSIIDLEILNINSFLEPGKIKLRISELLEKIISRNNLNIKNEPFNSGIIVNSKTCYNTFFENAVEDIKESGVNFFSPIIFSNSILNSITNFIIRNFNIRGYSNSYINSNLNNILVEFKFNPIDFLFFINIENISSKKNQLEICIMLFSKSKINLYLNQLLAFINVKKTNKFFVKNDIFIYNEEDLEKGIFKTIKENTFFYKFCFFIRQYLLNKNNINDKIAYIFKEEKKMFAYIIENKRNNNE